MNQKLPSIASLFKSAWTIYKTNLKTLALIMAIPLVIDLIAIFNVQNPIWAAISGLATYIGTLALICYIGRGVITAVVGGNAPVQAYRSAWSHLLSFIWLNIISALTVMGGAILFIIPGIYLSVAFIFSNFVLVNEDVRGRNILTRSWYYSRNYWWAIFGRVLLFGLVITVIFILLTLIAHALNLVEITTVGSQITTTPSPSAQAIGQILNLLVFLPLSLAYIYSLYLAIKVVKPLSSPTEEESLKKWITGLSILAFVVIVILIAAGGAFLAVFLTKLLPNLSELQNLP